MRIGSCTPSSRAFTSLPARTGAFWSGPGGQTLIVLARPAGISKNKPDLPVMHFNGDDWSFPQWLEEHRAKRCTVNLGELEQAWRAKAEAELAELLQTQAKYDEFKALPLVVLTA